MPTRLREVVADPIGDPEESFCQDPRLFTPSDAGHIRAAIVVYELGSSEEDLVARPGRRGDRLVEERGTAMAPPSVTSRETCIWIKTSTRAGSSITMVLPHARAD